MLFHHFHHDGVHHVAYFSSGGQEFKKGACLTPPKHTRTTRLSSRAQYYKTYLETYPQIPIQTRFFDYGLAGNTHIARFRSVCQHCFFSIFLSFFRHFHHSASFMILKSFFHRPQRDQRRNNTAKVQNLGTPDGLTLIAHPRRLLLDKRFLPRFAVS